MAVQTWQNDNVTIKLDLEACKGHGDCAGVLHLCRSLSGTRHRPQLLRVNRCQAAPIRTKAGQLGAAPDPIRLFERNEIRLH